MIRPLLRKLKQFLWRHAGITHLAENVVHTHRALGRLQGVLDLQGQTLCLLAAELARVDEIARQQETLRQELIEARRSLAHHEQGTAQAIASVLSTLIQHKATLRLLFTGTTQQFLQHQAAVQEKMEGGFAGVKSELTELAGALAGLREETVRLGASLGELRQSGETIRAETSEHHAGLAECVTALHAHLDAKAEALYAQGERIAASQQGFEELRAQGDRCANVLAQIDSWGLDKWRVQEYMGLIRYFRRKQYELEIATGRLPVPALETAHPAAVLSNDTLFPRGAKNDNSICPRFNRKLSVLLAHKPHLRVLDLGCAGGGFVRSLLDEGQLAVGLEGSPYPRENQLGEWGTIPHHLHTCDVTEPFTLRDPDTGAPLQFDAVTAWEVMEHIPEAALPGLLANVHRHLAPDGLFLCSIATFLDHDAEAGIIWHVTVKSKEWWIARFREEGFEVHEQDILNKDDWLRGSGHCRGDWQEEENLGFHLVLRRRAAARVAA